MTTANFPPVLTADIPASAKVVFATFQHVARRGGTINRFEAADLLGVSHVTVYRAQWHLENAGLLRMLWNEDGVVVGYVLYPEGDAPDGVPAVELRGGNVVEVASH